MKRINPRLLWFLVFLLLAFCFHKPLIVAQNALLLRMTHGKTTEERMRQYGPLVKTRLSPFFKRAGVSYPPSRLAFLGFKSEKRLDVYAGENPQALRLIRSYPILAASGGPGPKYQEGDLQVPEGIYGIDYLNPNSLYHLSMRISYPNATDLAQAKKEGRTHLGGDIMIHGNSVSIGCLAMGDEAAEDLFVLVALTGIKNVEILLSPADFRKTLQRQEEPDIPFVRNLYRTLRLELARFP